MFHVEHSPLEAAVKYPGNINASEASRLDKYAEMINESNSRFNLTGLKTLNEIKDILIAGSLLPFTAINVPRGTLIADIGTGAGIPGIPLSILMSNAKITLFDATQKKIEFINEVIKKLSLSNADALCGRVEEIGTDNIFRETFDWVITRAMADPYMASELGAPLLKTGGFLYLYTSEKQSVLCEQVLNHISELGLLRLNEEDKGSILNLQCGGILFKKIRKTDSRYPRRIKIIKRESAAAKHEIM